MYPCICSACSNNSRRTSRYVEYLLFDDALYSKSLFLNLPSVIDCTIILKKEFYFSHSLRYTNLSRFFNEVTHSTFLLIQYFEDATINKSSCTHYQHKEKLQYLCCKILGVLFRLRFSP